MLKKLLNLLKGGASATPPATTEHIFRNAFVLDAPEDFSRHDRDRIFQLMEPVTRSCITISAYEKSGGLMAEFCEHRFSTVEDVYKPVSERQPFEGPHVSGMVQDFEGTFPGESVPTYYVVLALQAGNLFLSMNIVTEREYFTANRGLYETILRSIRPTEKYRLTPGPGGAAG